VGLSALRLLFAPLGHFIAHRSRCLCVAAELHRRGHTIGFLTPPEGEAEITALGFQAFPVYSMPAHDVLAYGAPFEYQRRWLGPRFAALPAHCFDVERLASDDRAVYAAFQPDLVVCDARATTPLTAALAGIPAITINNLSMPIDNQPACDAAAEAQGTVCTTVERAFRAEFERVLGPAVRSNPRALRALRATPWIVPGLPALENPDKLALLGHPVHCHVGPLHWQGDDAKAATAPPREDGRPQVLVTLGSSFPLPRVLDAIARASEGQPWRLVLNMAGPCAPQAAGGREVLPAIGLRGYLATSDAVIHHGGHGTAMQVLRAGLPSVIIPFNGDQIDIARRMAGLGGGIRLDGYPEDLTPEVLREAVRAVLVQTVYRDNARRLQGELAAWPDGAVLAADFIEERAALQAGARHLSRASA
jgi:UDP:flavonoid glycosyltransferase YjiC (YdhE family)